jgi:tetratricopeptide (TPR) repeat protein
MYKYIYVFVYIYIYIYYIQGIVAYSREKYSLALEQFSKALQKHPKSPASIRVAIASCCFKLKHFDRARAILEKALASDVSFFDYIYMFMYIYKYC